MEIWASSTPIPSLIANLEREPNAHNKGIQLSIQNMFEPILFIFCCCSAMQLFLNGGTAFNFLMDKHLSSGLDILSSIQVRT